MSVTGRHPMVPRPLRRGVVARARALAALPPGSTSAPVQYTPVLVGYVTTLTVLAVVLALATVRYAGDAATLLLGAGAAMCIGVYSVRPFVGMERVWSAAVFVHLGMSITFGPIGALTVALGDEVGNGVRWRTGPFRGAFNVANSFLSNLVAWAIFRAISGPTYNEDLRVALAALAAGLAQFVVNHLLIAFVVKITGGEMLEVFMHSSLPALPYSIGYGWASFAFVVLQDRGSIIGFSAVLVPVVLLQGFLVALSRKQHVYELRREEQVAERAAYAAERERLLRRAIDAQEAERRRIARDLHDGVVQNLVGMALQLAVQERRMRRSAEAGASPLTDRTVELLHEWADEARHATRDLRTLIIEIAPPTLHRQGITAALSHILAQLQSLGVKTRLDLPKSLRLTQEHVDLLFRIAQELLRNISKHAAATHVEVRIEDVGPDVVLTVHDDGRGFSDADVQRRRAQGHVGTSVLEELAASAGATFTLASNPGQGTHATLILPTDEGESIDPLAPLHDRVVAAA